MKTFVLFCSPNKKGATKQLLDKFLMDKGIDDALIFSAYDIMAKPCVDCGYCKNNEGCAFSDLDELYKGLEEADFLIFATPLYFLSLPAPAKAVMDRMQRYYSARFFAGINPPIKKRKKMQVLVSYESEKYGGTEHIKEQFNMLSTVLNCEKPEFTAEKRRI